MVRMAVILTASLIQELALISRLVAPSRLPSLLPLVAWVAGPGFQGYRLAIVTLVPLVATWPS